jgi:hypothetical protein
MATVRLNLDQAKVRELLRGPNGPVGLHVHDLTRRVYNQAKVDRAYVPVDTGRLRNSHRHTLDVDSQGVVGMVGATAEYAEAVHEGTTGGPVTVKQHTRRHPRTGKAYVVRSHTRMTRPRRGNPWLTRAAQSVGLEVRTT